MSDYSRTINAYIAILQKFDVDVSMKALDWWARNHVNSTHIERAIEIAKRNGKVSAGYIARVVGNHIDPDKPHTLDRRLDTRDTGSRTFRAGEPWRESEKEELRDLVARNWPIQRIAETFDRTPIAIQNAIVRVHNGPVDRYPVYPNPIPSVEDWFKVQTLAEIKAARGRST